MRRAPCLEEEETPLSCIYNMVCWCYPAGEMTDSPIISRLINRPNVLTDKPHVHAPQTLSMAQQRTENIEAREI